MTDPIGCHRPNQESLSLIVTVVGRAEDEAERHAANVVDDEYPDHLPIKD